MLAPVFEWPAIGWVLCLCFFKGWRYPHPFWWKLRHFKIFLRRWLVFHLSLRAQVVQVPTKSSFVCISQLVIQPKKCSWQWETTCQYFFMPPASWLILLIMKYLNASVCYGNFLYYWLLSPATVKMLTQYKNMGFVCYFFFTLYRTGLNSVSLGLNWARILFMCKSYIGV